MSIRQGSTIIAGSSGSGGTSNYNNLENKPSINGITLEGNKTTEDLNINSLPDQTGNEGKVLITNGTEASWQTLPETGLPLFAHIWSDHLLTNSSYLRADTFSWQDGNIYYTAYNELVNEKNLTTETSTDTINNITITYYRTPKGYKIVLPDMADNLVQLYESTGTAWYYILDTDNTRFKLPRNSRYESGTTTDNAGDFGAESLPNITGGTGFYSTGKEFGSFYATDYNSRDLQSVGDNARGVGFAASKSSPAYQDGAKVNTDHVTQFLYFYVGNTIQNETTINIAEITEALNNKADRDFGNITDGTYQVLTTKNITNCITKIPQDIKLELSTDGTLTLKAGSIAYMPNGTGVFNKVMCIEDKTYKPTWGAGYKCLVTGYVNGAGNIGGIGMCRSDLHFSGESAPDATINGTLWYDTSENKLKAYRNNVWNQDSINEPRTFFLGIVTVGNGNIITSIDQVFNGFGYIGSTIFALPGVEGLIPNGRNTNGSLNNIKFMTSRVLLLERFQTTSPLITYINGGGLSQCIVADVFEQEENPNKTFSNWYIPSKNIWYRSNETTQWGLYSYCPFATLIQDSTGRITSFKPKTTFNAIDRNDTEWASTASKPSDRYIDLTLQANGTTYTAPANGTVYFAKQAGATTPVYLWIENTNSSLSNISWINSGGSSDFISVSLPVAAGDVFKVYYTAKGNTNYFRFIYDEGSK